jgi:ribose 5-phosphate isomerase A
MGTNDEKRLAAEAAAELVEDGMTVGLGTGSTVAHLLPAIVRRGLTDIRCVATSVATEEQARELGIPVEEFSELQRLDIAIDGTDQVTPDGWLIKGGGGAHLREKIVAAAAERFVVIADSTKPVDSLSPPIPPER